MARVGRLRVKVSAVATLLCAACSSSSNPLEPNELTIEVQGTITALGTRVPIDSAFIEVRTTSAGGFAEVYSDSTGQYSFSFVYRYFPGELFCPFLVFVSHAEFVGEIFSLRCVEGVQTVDVQLEAASPGERPQDSARTAFAPQNIPSPPSRMIVTAIGMRYITNGFHDANTLMRPAPTFVSSRNPSHPHAT